MTFAVGRGIQVKQQRWFSDGCVEKFGEWCMRQAAKCLVLPAHHGQIPDLLVAAGKVVVPQERQPLAQRVGREEHPVHPPGLESIDVKRIDRRIGQ